MTSSFCPGPTTRAESTPTWLGPTESGELAAVRLPELIARPRTIAAAARSDLVAEIDLRDFISLTLEFRCSWGFPTSWPGTGWPSPDWRIRRCSGRT